MKRDDIDRHTVERLRSPKPVATCTPSLGHAFFPDLQGLIEDYGFEVHHLIDPVADALSTHAGIF